MKLLLASVMDSEAFESIEQLCDKPARETRVAYIPTAAVPEGDTPPWLADDIARWQSRDFKLRFVDLRRETADSLARIFEEIDVVYCSGGNTFYLLDQIVRSWLHQVLLDFLTRGGVWAGASAGALVATPEIEPAYLVDDCEAAPDLDSTKGMGLVGFAVVPHYVPGEGVWERIRADYERRGYETIPLPDGAHIRIEGKTRTIVPARRK